MTLFPGANVWRAGMQDVSAAIDDTMGEAVIVTPARSGGVNFPTIPEPERSISVTAVFTAKPETVVMGDNKVHARGHSMSPLISTSVPVFSFDHKSLPWPLKQGYRIKLCRTGAIYEVTDIKDDSVARIEVKVVRLGRGLE
ncbi:hypothetical protein ABIB90_002743 [Bradyrhizobium sp. JR4.1]|uniref:hypothetical protein n=1 Tax=Bradyrhizobium sp. JR4.1 TaxID=3156372 RepID=UPI003398C69D